MFKKTLNVLCLLLAALVVFSPTMNAQISSTGNIAGYVTDNDKGPLPGATVTVTSPTMVGTRQAVSDMNGYYRLAALPPGKFKILVALDQFNTQTRQDVELNVGALLRIDFTMTPKTMEKELVVTATAPLVETEKTSMDTVVDTSILNSMPILGRDFMSSIKILPGVSETMYGTSISGGRDESKNYNIDGSDNVDILDVSVSGGGTTSLGGSPFMSFDQEAVQELSVGRGGFSADVGFGSGGVVNVITKSGSNNMHGSLYFTMRDSKLDTDATYPFHTYYFGGSLGGPIIKDKLLFFLSLSPTYNRTGFDTRDYYNAHVPADLMTTSKGLSSFLKLSWLLNKSNTLNISANVPWNKSNSYCTLWHTAPNFPEGDFKNTGFMLNASETAILNSNLILESTLSGGQNIDKTINMSPEENPGLILDFGLYPEVGCATGTYFINEKLSRKKFNWSEKLSWFVEDWGGRHAISVGFEVRSNKTGQWKDYENSITLFPWFYQLMGLPAREESITNPYNLEFSQTYVGGYVSDAWTPIKRLTLRPGVRISRNSYMPKTLVEPRFDFSYDLFGDAKTVVRGGANLYYERINTTAQMLSHMPLRTYIETYADGSTVTYGDTYQYYVIDPNLTYPKTTEFAFGIERGLTKDMDLSIELIHRNYNGQFYHKAVNLRDRTTGQRDDPTKGGLSYYGNLGHAKYTAINVILQKKFSHGNQFMLSYSYQASKGNSSMFLEATQLQYVFNSNSLFKGDPQLVDFNGRTNFDKPYDFKAFGSVTLPFQIVFAGVFNYTAGTPFTNYNYDTRTMVDGYQTQRSPSTLNLDLRLEKSFRIGGNKMLRLMADGFNVTNRQNVFETIADVSNNIGEYGTPYSLGSPRVIQLAARFEW